MRREKTPVCPFCKKVPSERHFLDDPKNELMVWCLNKKCPLFGTLIDKDEWIKWLSRVTRKKNKNANVYH